MNKSGWIAIWRGTASLDGQPKSEALICILLDTRRRLGDTRDTIPPPNLAHEKLDWWTNANELGDCAIDVQSHVVDSLFRSMRCQNELPSASKVPANLLKILKLYSLKRSSKIPVLKCLLFFGKIFSCLYVLSLHRRQTSPTGRSWFMS